MLSGVIIENFQSHKTSEIEFVSGVNIICGLSQSGKTALLRAIYFVAKNRPRGDNFIRQGADGTCVSLIGKVDGKAFSVTREKGEADNCYRVIVGDEEVEFRAFGSDVPEKIQELLNLTDVNIQDQLSPYFLVLDSPGQIATYIRSIAKLDEIDDVVKMLAARIKITSGDIKKAEEDFKENAEKLVLLEKIKLDELEKSIGAYEECDGRSIRIDSQIHELVFFLNTLTLLEEDLAKVNAIDITLLTSKCEEYGKFITACSSIRTSVLDLSRIVEGLEEVYAEDFILPTKSNLNILTTKCSACSDFVDERDLLMVEVYDLNQIICGLEDVESTEINIPPDVDEKIDVAKECFNQSTFLADDIRYLVFLISDISSYSTTIQEVGESLIVAVDERECMMGELDTCPSCGQDLDNVSKKHLLEGSCSTG